MTDTVKRDAALAKWKREVEGASIAVTSLMRSAYRDGWDDALAAAPSPSSEPVTLKTVQEAADWVFGGPQSAQPIYQERIASAWVDVDDIQYAGAQIDKRRIVYAAPPQPAQGGWTAKTPAELESMLDRIEPPSAIYTNVEELISDLHDGSAVVLDDERRPAKSHCQNGGDVCLAGNRDGICCPEDSCDIDDGIRAASVPAQTRALTDEQINAIAEIYDKRWASSGAWNVKRCVQNALVDARALLATGGES